MHEVETRGSMDSDTPSIGRPLLGATLMTAKGAFLSSGISLEDVEGAIAP
jgi:hypothetical protein